MKDRYRHERDLRRPRQEKLDALYEMIEGGTEMKHAKRLSGRAAAILVCAALAITAAAAAAVPAVWEKLWEQLGAFAPYAQTIDGAVCRTRASRCRCSAPCPTIWKPGFTWLSGTWRGTG